MIDAGDIENNNNNINNNNNGGSVAADGTESKEDERKQRSAISRSEEGVDERHEGGMRSRDIRVAI